jgi:type I site-specific restriction-modification system R (restriction) subunit
MACLSGKLLTDPRMENPTLVIVTDRQDLDGQLFGVFAGAGDPLGESPKQANSRQELRDLLANRPSGGIIFTTIQKFATEPDEDQFPQAAQDLMGDEVLIKMARELAEKLRGNLSIDWQDKQNVRAKLRTMIKALLKRYKYPPDQDPAAIELGLQQTEMISEEWAREDLGRSWR